MLFDGKCKNIIINNSSFVNNRYTAVFKTVFQTIEISNSEFVNYNQISMKFINFFINC